MLSGYDIVCLSNTYWEGHMTSKQHIMLRLAKNNRVLYVNKGMSFLSPFSGLDEISASRQLKDAFLRPRLIVPNLYVASPPVLFPLRFLTVSAWVNSAILTLWLRATIRRLGMKKIILWTFLPETGGVVGRINESLSIYHCVDEHAAAKVWWRTPGLVTLRETELIKKVDLVITTAHNLQRRKAAVNSNCFFVPNAVNFELFQKATLPETLVPPEFVGLKRPVVGYVGMLYSDLIDIELVEYLAKKLDYSFVFIGRKLGNFDMERLQHFGNIHFLGFKEPDTLPSYLKGIDVCMMPSRQSDLMEAVFPLKLFEYLAAGKPVVATRTAELEPYSCIVSLVDTAEEFLESLKACLQNNSDARIRERVNAARTNTWEARIETLSKLILKHLEARPQGPKC